MWTMAFLGRYSLASLALLTVIGSITAPPPPASKDWTKYLTAYSGGGSRRAVPESPSTGEDVKTTGPLPVTTSPSAAGGLKSILSLKPGKLGPPSFIVPFIPPRPVMVSPMSPFLMPGPVLDPNLFVSPKIALLNSLFGTVSTSKTFGKRDERSTVGVLRPIAENTDVVNGLMTTPIETFVLPPTAVAAGAVDPTALISKRIKFLNDLFDVLGLPPSVSTVVTRAIVPPPNPISPIVPETIPVLETTTLPPIVPPDFWTPTAMSDFGPKGFMDKTTVFLDKLFKTLNKTVTTTATPPATTLPTISKRASESEEALPVSSKAPPVEKLLPPSFWLPDAEDPLGPEGFINKKTTFLNGLFGGLAPSKRVLDGVSVTANEKLAGLNDIYDDLLGLEDKIANLSTRGVGTVPASATNVLLDIPADLLITSPDQYSGKDSTSLDALLNDLADFSVVDDPQKAIYQRAVAETPEDSPTTNSTVPNVVSAILTAKDQIVNSIVSELSVLKTDMMTTMAELSKAEKASASKIKPTKKPPFASPFSPFSWMPVTTPKPSSAKVIATGAKKRLQLLSDVFDMLADLEKSIVDTVDNLTTTIKDSEAAAANIANADNATTINTTSVNDSLINNLLAFGKKNITHANSTLTNDTSPSVSKSAWARAVTPSLLSSIDTTTTEIPTTPPSESGFPFMMDPTFWMPDPAAGPGPVDPSFFMTKTKTFLDKLFSSGMMGPPTGMGMGPKPGGPMGFGGPMGSAGPMGASGPAAFSPWISSFAPKPAVTTESTTTTDLFD